MAALNHAAEEVLCSLRQRETSLGRKAQTWFPYLIEV